MKGSELNYSDKVNIEHEGRELTVYVDYEELILQRPDGKRSLITDAREIRWTKICDSDTGEEINADFETSEIIRGKVARVLNEQEGEIDPTLASPIVGDALGVLRHGVTVFDSGEDKETHYDQFGRKTSEGKIRDIS